DNWLEKAIRIDKNNTVCTCSFRFEEGVFPEYGIFYVTDDGGKLLPIHLPIYRKKAEVQMNLKALADCRAVRFDASQVGDSYGCIRSFFGFW
ncbi:MAG: hypothetical protein DRG25_01945, partial [Deltaproteobacteria bacterium]